MSAGQGREERRRKLAEVRQKLEERRLPAGPDKPATGEQPADLPSREAARQSLVERKIQEAMAEGAFDNLPGKGKPLALNRNPYLAPGQDLAFGLLKKNGMAPEWIERDRAIRRELAETRRQLRRAWEQYGVDPARQATWGAAVSRFEERLTRLNRQIDDLNLIAPAVTCQRSRLRLAVELRRAQGY